MNKKRWEKKKTPNCWTGCISNRITHWVRLQTIQSTDKKKKRRRRKSNQTEATEIMIRYRFHYCLWASIKHTSEISLKFFFFFLVSVAVHCFYFDTFWICIYVFHLFLYDLVFFVLNFSSISIQFRLLLLSRHFLFMLAFNLVW